MKFLHDVVWIELRKALRSRLPLFTILAFLLLPLAAGFFMLVLKDPELARKSGLISTKAHLAAGTADWPSYLSVLTQAVATGGIFFFGFICSWVFGREYSDGTVKDLLALPVSRFTILLAKFIVVGLASVLMTVLLFVVALALGAWIGLPQGTPDLILQGSLKILITVGLVICLMAPVAFFANAGRGYLLPMGITILVVILANIVAVAGWGSYFPWAIPALYSEAAGSAASGLEPASFWIVFLTGVAGLVATHLWWQYADQSH
jgi:ABC-2 type transport system permease protein